MAILRYIAALDPGGAAGTPAVFNTPSGATSSASYYQEQTNITGAAGAVVTLQVTTYTVTNSYGEALVNSVQVFLNSTFTVTLDGAGNGSFIARVQGDATQTGSIVRAIFTITGVSIGQTGSPSAHQISKTF